MRKKDRAIIWKLPSKLSKQLFGFKQNGRFGMTLHICKAFFATESFPATLRVIWAQLRAKREVFPALGDAARGCALLFGTVFENFGEDPGETR